MDRINDAHGTSMIIGLEISASSIVVFSPIDVLGGRKPCTNSQCGGVVDQSAPLST
jgi:hypothetical protein